MLSVVPLSKYYQESGETEGIVRGRLQRGNWREGKEVIIVSGSKERWVDLVEVEKWVRNGGSFQAA